MTNKFSSTVFVQAQGPSSGPAVVFLHGTPGDRRMWSTVASHAPASVRSFLVDLPDHGAAPDDLALDYAAFETAAIEVARAAAKGGPVVLAGVSLGAYLAARVLPALGDVVRHAVLVGGFALLPQDGVQMRLELADQVESGAASPSALRAITLELMLGKKHHRPEDEALVEQVMLTVPAPRLLRSLRRVASLGRPEAQVAPFATRATVVHATGDAAVPVALGEALAERGSNVTWLPIASDAHLLPVTQPEKIAELVFAPLNGA